MTRGHTDHAEPVSDDATPRQGGYETRDARAAPLLTFGVGLIVFIVVVQIAMLGFYRIFMAESPRKEKIGTQENLYQQLRALRDHENAAIGGYGWVDRGAGVVRIPIDRAIELIAEKGVPFGKGPKTELEMNSHAGSPVPSDGSGAKP